MVGTIRVARMYKRWTNLGDCDWVEVAWDEIEKAETQRRLAKCDVILCEPLYAPHFDRVIWRGYFT